MAGDWIKWVVGLADKPEVVHMAAVLNLTPDDIASKLMRVWEWADANVGENDITNDGFGVAKLSPDDVANMRFFDERVRVQNFAFTMQSVGWILFQNGSVLFPNFALHNGDSAKSRARKSIQQNILRQKKRGKNVSPNCRQIVGDLSPKCRRKSTTREEKRREEEIEEQKTLQKVTESTPDDLPQNANEAVSPEPENPPPKAKKARKPKPPKEPPKPRPRDLLFDSIAEVCGVDPKIGGSFIAKAANLLRQGEPPYTPDEVRLFASVYHLEFPFITGKPTINQLLQHIGKVRANGKANETGNLFSGSNLRQDPARIRSTDEERELGRTRVITGGGDTPESPTEPPPHDAQTP